MDKDYEESRFNADEVQDSKIGEVEKREIPLLFGGIIFLLCGLAFIGLDVWYNVQWHTFNKRGIPTTAVVTEVITSTPDESGCDYYVHFDYDYNGQTYKNDFMTSRSSYKEGNELTVLVDSENPEKALPKRPYDGTINYSLMAGLAFCFGGVLLIRCFIKKE